MKKLLFAFMLLLLGCTYPAQQEMRNLRTIDSLTLRIHRDSLTIVALQNELDSIKNVLPLEVYMNARRLEKIKYYISITDRRPANKEFFFGWIKRTMTE